MDKVKTTLRIKLSEYLFSIQKQDVNYSIAKVMLERIDELDDLSIDLIAYLANTTPSSVTKFFKKIDYNGFNNIKNTSFNFYNQRSIQSITPDSTDIYEYYHTIINRLTESYLELYNSYDHKKIAKLAKIILESRKVGMIIGIHGFATANFFEELMRPYQIIVYEINRHSDTSMIVDIIKQTGITFVLSLTGDWANQNSELLKHYEEQIVLLTINKQMTMKNTIILPELENNYSSNILSQARELSFFILLAGYIQQLQTK